MLKRLIVTSAFSWLVVLLFAAWWTPALALNDPQPANYCPPGWLLDRSGSYCTSPDGTTILPNVPPPAINNSNTPANNAPSNRPANNTPARSPSGSALPECTDNYNAAQICLPKSPFNGKLTNSTSLVQLAAEVIRILLYFAGIVAVIFVIIGGYKYMTAGGNEESAGKGRKTMVQAIIGLVIVILSYVIITTITNYLTK